MTVRSSYGRIVEDAGFLHLALAIDRHGLDRRASVLGGVDDGYPVMVARGHHKIELELRPGGQSPSEIGPKGVAALQRIHVAIGEPRDLRRTEHHVLGVVAKDALKVVTFPVAQPRLGESFEPVHTSFLPASSITVPMSAAAALSPRIISLW